MAGDIQRGGGLVFGSDEGDAIWIHGDVPSVVYAGAGDDGVKLSYQQDTAYLGEGNDMAYAEDGSDMVYGEAGDDLLYGGEGNDWLDGGEGNDFLRGSEGSDQLFGGAGDDLIYDESGINAMYGSLGNDTIMGGNQQDAIFAGEDDDIVLGGDGGDWISGGSGHNQLSGQGGDDILSGSGDGENRSNEIFYSGNDGNDLVNRFNAETDQIMITADINGTGIESSADLASHISAYGEEGTEDSGALIDLGEGSSIQLAGVDPAQATANLSDYFTVA